ncbi:MAG TPA: histidine phosphatase family protein [Acidimicrobiales bacterium]|nr:histidine phosphatase family protein [Acidimicrobiales bacterium]
MAETRLVLIRHGEAQCHVEQRVGGPKGCTGLSDEGRRQAALLRDRLARTGELSGAQALYSSTLPRAVETAEIIASAVGGGLAVKQEADLSEIDPGMADGMPWERFREEYMPEPYQWDAFRPMAPGAESWASFMARVGAGLQELARRHAGETVVAACHGGVIEGAWVALGQLPIVSHFEHDVWNTSITEWVLRPSRRGTEAWALTRFNDSAHLL